jgi:hypothetical protein
MWVRPTISLPRGGPGTGRAAISAGELVARHSAQKLATGALPIVNPHVLANGLPTVNLTANDLAEIAAKPDGATYFLSFSVIADPIWPLCLQVTSTLASLQVAVNAQETATVLLGPPDGDVFREFLVLLARDDAWKMLIEPKQR